MSTTPSLIQHGDVTGSVSVFPPCSRCGGPRDRGARQRYCRTCHAKNMRAWRSTHQSIPKPATFHGKPFVNPGGARPEEDMSTLAVCFALWAWLAIFVAATMWFAVLPVLGILWLAGWL